MSLMQLTIRDFRNIAAAELEFSPQLNLITGRNGAGKTSLLEAVHFLGRAQSFRSSHTSPVIRAGTESLLVAGQVTDQFGVTVPVGVQRARSTLRVRMAGRTIQHLAELIERFPFQILTPDSHQVIEGGPRHRRRFLDWGVFHVEPSFLPVWQNYSRALRQRNAALRSRSSQHEITMWDSELVTSTALIDQQRRDYIEQLLAALSHYATDLLDVGKIQWEYRPGWPRKSHYAEALAESLEGDRRHGYTRIGPHRADLAPLLEGQPAQDRVSRGQQKQLVAALMLAQARVYQDKKKAQACIFLIDDLASELDSARRACVLQHLCQLGTQVFLTAIDVGSIDQKMWSQRRQFHVEHGHIGEVIY